MFIVKPQPKGKLKVVNLPYLPLVEPVLPRSKSEDQALAITSENLGDIQYVPIEDNSRNDFSHFSILIDEDGNPWELGNLFLLSLTEYPAKSSDSIKKGAYALAHFNDVMLGRDLNIFDFPLRKNNRPTYAYHYYWRDETKENEGRIGYANTLINWIVDFYRWLCKRGFNPEKDMWKESKKYIRVKTKRGAHYEKQIIVTDLTLKQIKKTNNKSLKGYDQEQQKAIIKALKNIDNTEMTLGFYAALTTSARIQTVFTLQKAALADFEMTTVPDDWPVMVGFRGLADTKFKKRFPIYIPGWLAKALVNYISSVRHAHRVSISKMGDTEINYIFLTKSGNPYYASEDDPYLSSYERKPNGNGIRSFIRQTLEPELKKLGFDFKVRFHNLRATFANNLATKYMVDFNQRKISWSEMLTIVSERLAHSSIDETENYINELVKLELTAIAQDEFETFLQNILEDNFTKGENEQTPSSL